MKHGISSIVKHMYLHISKLSLEVDEANMVERTWDTLNHNEFSDEVQVLAGLILYSHVIGQNGTTGKFDGEYIEKATDYVDDWMENPNDYDHNIALKLSVVLDRKCSEWSDYKRYDLIGRIIGKTKKNLSSTVKKNITRHRKLSFVPQEEEDSIEIKEVPREFNINGYKKPSELVTETDKYVIGQEHVKKAVAMHIFTHQKAVCTDDDMKKQNLLVIGDTGTGKTYTIEVMAKILGKKLKVIDVSSITKEGYVGMSLSTIYKDMIQEAVAEGKVKGDKVDFSDFIFFIDEFDKLASDLDVLADVQCELLKLLEGAELQVSFKNNDDNVNSFDSRSLCIILGGSFAKLIEKKRADADSQVGFTKEKRSKKQIEAVEHADIIKYGIKSEVVGRIGNIVQTNPIDDETLRVILTEPKNCVKEYYTKLFNIHGIKDKVYKKDINEILKRAKKLKLGARSLWAVSQEYFSTRMFY